MSSRDEQAFIDEIRLRLDQGLESVPSEVMQRLDSMRADALQAPKLAISIEDEPLVAAARQSLDDHEPLPANIEARLDQIRQQAMSRLPQKSEQRDSWLQTAVNWLRSQLQLDFSATAGMLATACLTITVASLFYASRPEGVISLEDEMMLVASAEELELYENLDFYLWLAENGLSN